jgi:hypothetical protein
VRRHDLDLTSLLAGLLLVALGLVTLVGDAVGLRLDARWMLPAVLVGLGVAGLAGSLRPGSRD